MVCLWMIHVFRVLHAFVGSTATSHADFSWIPANNMTRGAHVLGPLWTAYWTVRYPLNVRCGINASISGTRFRFSRFYTRRRFTRLYHNRIPFLLNHLWTVVQ